MKLKVNNAITELPAHETLADVLKKLSMYDKQGIAVAVNARVITRSNWTEYSLSESDEIIIIEAAQGG